MSNVFKVHVDAASLAQSFGELRQDVERAVTDGVRLASAMAYAHANELARERLHSRLRMFLDALSYKKIDDGIWAIELDEKATWIDDGMEPHDMKENLLRKNYKVAKDGSRYKIIPFDHGKPPTEQTSKQQELAQQIKSELKSRKIPYKKIEVDEKGSPRLGRLHTFNVEGSARPTPKSSHPALQGVNIYQRKNGEGKIRRDIVTFRVVSSKQTDKWHHPGLKPVNIFDDTYKWVMGEFENRILPDVLAAFDANQK